MLYDTKIRRNSPRIAYETPTALHIRAPRPVIVPKSLAQWIGTSPDAETLHIPCGFARDARIRIGA